MKKCARPGCGEVIHEIDDMCPAHQLEFMGGGRENTKVSNPKDVIGSTKVPLHLCMGPSLVYWCLGQLEGLLKYGKVNWRTAGVRSSIYIDAAERHLKKFSEGEWADSKTKIPHLGSLMACAAIIIDAHEAGMLIDDRPKRHPAFGRVLDEWGPAMVAHLKDLFKDHNPHHHLIGDSLGPLCPKCGSEDFKINEDHELEPRTCNTCGWCELDGPVTGVAVQ